jgi:hypothetical protein
MTKVMLVNKKPAGRLREDSGQALNNAIYKKIQS